MVNEVVKAEEVFKKKEKEKRYLWNEDPVIDGKDWRKGNLKGDLAKGYKKQRCIQSFRIWRRFWNSSSAWYPSRKVALRTTAGPAVEESQCEKLLSFWGS